ELKESFPEDYGSGSDEATERKFERDKAELLELGIPLTYVQGDEDRKDGFLAGGEMATPKVRMELGAVRESAAVPEHLETLWTAASARKWVEIVYASP